MLEQRDWSSKDLGDEQALYNHCYQLHQDQIKISRKLSDAFKIVFIEKPTKFNLDAAEKFWIKKLNAKINIYKNPLPSCQSFC